MLLHSLRMKNFKRYRDQEIRFQDGITGIVGNNGTGKSTIVEAILFALFGLQGTGLDGNYIVSSFAGPRDLCEVRLDFGLDGNTYSVVRKFKKRPGSTLHEARMYANGRPFSEYAEGVQNVMQGIQRVIGMNPVDFKNTIYAGQRDLLSLLESRAGSRKEWFMRVLGIDFLKKGSMDELRAQIDGCEKEYGNLQSRIAELDADGAIKKQLRALEGELKAARQQADRIDREIADTGQRRDAALSERDRLQRAREEHIRLQGEEQACLAGIAVLEADMADLADQIAHIESSRTEYERLVSLEGRYQELRRLLPEIAEKKNEFERLTEKRGHLCDLLEQHEGRRESIRRDLDRLSQDEDLIADLFGKVERWKELEERLDRLRGVEPEYTRLREDLSRHEERFRHLENRVLEIRRDIAALEDKSLALASLQGEVSAYDELRAREEILSRAAVHAERVQACTEKIEEDAAQLRASDADLAALSRQCEGGDAVEQAIADREARREELAAEVSACAARRQAAHQELLKQQARLAEIVDAGADGACPMCHRSLGEQYADLVAELEEGCASLQRLLAGLETEHRRLSGERGSLVDELSRLQEERSRYRNLQEQIVLCRSKRGHIADQMAKRQAERERHASALREIGIAAYDPADHAALTEQLRELERKRVMADTLRGECARLPHLYEERRRYIHEVRDYLTEREAIENEIGLLSYDPEEIRELEREKRVLDAPYREYLNAQAELRQKPVYEEELETVSAKIAALHEEIREIDLRCKELAFDPEHHRQLSKEHQHAEEMHQRLQKLRFSMEQLPRLQARREEKHESLGASAEQLLRIREAMEALGFDDSQVSEVEEMVRSLDERLSALAGEAKAISGRIQVLESESGRLRQALARVEGYRRASDALLEEIEMLKLTRKLIADYTVYLLQVVRDRIEGETGRILGEITDGRYDSVLLDDDFTVLVHDAGEDYPADRFSGGEQDDIAIALRIALSRFLAEINGIHESTFLIFDEIFGSQDEERRNNLIRALRTQETYFPQIFLISHIADILGEFSTTLLIELGADQASRVQENG